MRHLSNKIPFLNNLIWLKNYWEMLFVEEMAYIFTLLLTISPERYFLRKKQTSRLRNDVNG